MSSTDGVNVREAGLDNKRNKPRRKNKKKCKVCGGSAKGLGRKNILSIQSDNVLPGVRLFKKNTFQLHTQYLFWSETFLFG